MQRINCLHVARKIDAWKIVTLFSYDCVDFVYDSMRSERAGYPIFTDQDEDAMTYVCDLGNRLEINFYDGSSQNIWIDGED